MRRCKRWARSRGSGRRRTVLLCFIFYGSFPRPAHWGSRTRMPVIAVTLLHGLMWGFPKGPPAKRREPALEQSERSASAASLLAESCARAHTHLTLSLTNDYAFTKKSVYLLTDPSGLRVSDCRSKRLSLENGRTHILGRRHEGIGFTGVTGEKPLNSDGSDFSPPSSAQTPSP